MEKSKLEVLNVTEYNLLATKNPTGSYDRKTRENLYWVIEKLRQNIPRLSFLENKIFTKFQNAQFEALGEKEKKVKNEIARYRISNNLKQTLKIVGSTLGILIILTGFIYQFILDDINRKKVEVAYYAGLNKVGLVSKGDFEQIRQDLNLTFNELEIAKKQSEEMIQTIETMISNNKVTDNLKYIIKQIYRDPRAKYIKTNKEVSLSFDGKPIATYLNNPKLWYILGVVEAGLIRLYYDNEEILEFRSIFGRQGEETPLGEYKIKNRVFKPTWYKKEIKKGKKRVRAIPFGHPEHEIGYWWLGLKRLNNPVPGSYGIHGVNITRVNEFYKKNFDWRNGSAGCPNVQDWYLNFLAKVVPIGTSVNIVFKDKWSNGEPIHSSAA
jgi:hypothetical protein